MVLRRVEALLDRGVMDAAAKLHHELSQSEPEVLDARGWLLRARVQEHLGDSGASVAYGRALLLEAPRGSTFAARFVASCDDPEIVDRFAELVKAAGWIDQPHWRSAFARRRSSSRRASAARCGFSPVSSQAASSR